jgi:hypothetical protein
MEISIFRHFFLLLSQTRAWIVILILPSFSTQLAHAYLVEIGPGLEMVHQNCIAPLRSCDAKFKLRRTVIILTSLHNLC